MRIEYATITRSDDQTLDCVGNRTRRTFRDVEFLEDSNIDSPPRVGEIGLVAETGNAEFTWLGRLKQFQSGLSPNELRLHPKLKTGLSFTGQDNDSELVLYRSDIEVLGKSPNEVYTYKITEGVYITKDGEIIIQRENTGTPTSKIKITNTDKIEIEGDGMTVTLAGNLTINVTGNVDLTATGTVDITGSTINLN